VLVEPFDCAATGSLPEPLLPELPELFEVEPVVLDSLVLVLLALDRFTLAPFALEPFAVAPFAFAAAELRAAYSA
jgi:hypothetical protein